MKKIENKIKLIHLFWMLPLVLFIGWIIGCYTGYKDKNLNLDNSIDLCKSHYLNWCETSVDKIVCSNSTECYRGNRLTIFDRKTMGYICDGVLSEDSQKLNTCYDLID